MSEESKQDKGTAPESALERLERESAEQAARIELLLESNEYLDRLASIAAHDLKSPLRRINSFLALIESAIEGEAKPEIVDWMHSVNDNAEYMQQLVDDLLDLSRVSEFTLEMTKLDLNQVVQRAVSNLQDVLDNWSGELIIEPLPPVYGSETLITRLFQNLLHNAIVYSKQDAALVKVSAETSDAAIVIRIEDNGIGIAGEYHEAVFEIFRRLHTRQEYGGGTGMGLAICRRIMMRHNGNIALESEPEIGTTLILRFESEHPELNLDESQ